MPLDIPSILKAILDQYKLPWDGAHGIAHWARVMENGLRLTEATGAHAEVVRLFAIFHDCRRINETTDPGHGPRAADFAAKLRGREFDLPDEEFKLLHRACAGHTHERTHPDITIQTCWDSDRLDLGRVGVAPPSLSALYRGGQIARSTEMGRRPCLFLARAGVREGYVGD